MPHRVLFGSLLLLAGCSHGPEQPVKQADGGYRLTCQGALTACLERAERLCRDKGYVVSTARDVPELLGHEAGQSQIEVRRSEATVYCSDSAPPPERAIVEVKRDTPLTSPTAHAPAAPASQLACVPGVSESCVGPGGCKGGQVCAPDGSHFEACDCSDKKPLDNGF